MRANLLINSLCFLLMTSFTLAIAHEHKHEGYQQDNLSAHEHGRVMLNMAIDEQTVEINLDSPAINMLGFEHAARNDEEKQLVLLTKEHLNTPLTLFDITPSADCQVTNKSLTSPLFDQLDNKVIEHHLDITANYTFTCHHISALNSLDLSSFFKVFPNTHHITVQYIDATQQKGIDLTPKNAIFKFK